MNFENVEIPWSDKLIMICTRCGAKTNAPDCSERMKSELKTEIKETNQKEKFRAISTSCLSICPENRVAIVTISRGGSHKAVTVEPEYSARLEDF